MMQRRIVCATIVAALSNGVSAQTASDIEAKNRKYYRDRGTNFSLSVTSDPRGLPYPYPNPDRDPLFRGNVENGSTPAGSTRNLPRETRIQENTRIQAEQDEYIKRRDSWREPPLKFNIKPPEMPKPNTVK